MDFTPESFQAAIQGAGALADGLGKIADLSAKLKGLISGSKSGADPEVIAALDKLDSEVRYTKIACDLLQTKVALAQRELAAANAMDAKLAEYELVETKAGNFVYAHKDRVQAPDRGYFICPKCVEHRKHSILQGGARHKKCKECGSTFVFDDRTPDYAPSRGDWMA